jgi:hypothetical protein
MALPATELAVRDWLRTVPELLTAVGNDPRRIDVDYSGTKTVTHMTMFRSGGGPSVWTPLDDAVMTFLCWGKGRGAALSLATTLADTLRTTTEIPLNEDAWLRGSSVQSVLWMPDEDGQPRYAVIARITASARQTASV